MRGGAANGVLRHCFRPTCIAGDGLHEAICYFQTDNSRIGVWRLVGSAGLRGQRRREATPAMGDGPNRDAGVSGIAVNIAGAHTSMVGDDRGFSRPRRRMARQSRGANVFRRSAESGRRTSAGALECTIVADGSDGPDDSPGGGALGNGPFAAKGAAIGAAHDGGTSYDAAIDKRNGGAGRQGGAVDGCDVGPRAVTDDGFAAGRCGLASHGVH